MAYTPPTISGYNASPPPDDGSATSDNEITWAKHKSKLADPLKTYADAINTAVGDAFDLVPFRATSAKAANYTIGATDNGLVFTSSAAITGSLPAAATAGNGFVVGFVNTSASNTLTIAPDGTDTIRGSNSNYSVRPTSAALLMSNGTAWFVIVDASNYLPLAGGTMTGALTNTNSNNTSLAVAHITLARGSGAGNSAVLVTNGDTSNGVDRLQLRIGSNAIATLHASSNRLRLLGDPLDVLDAAPKQYVDAAVIAGTYGLTAGAVGSLAFAEQVSATGVTYGSTDAGSNLLPTNAGNSNPATALSGTWRCLGRASSSAGKPNQTTLWLRVS